jgi:ADP-ribose pyrophosphatase YjhB (NUDIX family)
MKCSCLATIFVEERKKVLLIKRRDVPVWVLPGGGVEPEEPPQEAIVREVMEETNLTVEVERKIAVYHPVNRLTHPTHLFSCRIVSGSIQATQESEEVGFFDLKSLPKDLFFIHRDMIKQALQNLEGVQNLKFTQVTYLALAKYFIQRPLHVVRFLLSQAGFPINKKNPRG